MRRLIVCVLFVGLAALCLPVPGWSQSSAPRKLAFLVGVDKYQKDGLRDLKYAGDDAEELAAVLKQHGFDVTALLRGQATGAVIRQRFASFTERTKTLNKNDIVLVSFSGHGIEKEIKRNGKLESEPYFCPCDALKSEAETLISISEVMNSLVSASGSSQNLMLIDACRDDPTKSGKGAKGIDGSTVKELPAKLSLLFACSSGQRSFESDKVRHGVFTYLVIEALRGKARDEEGEVSWLDLASYVQKTVPRRLPDLMESQDAGLVQRPNLLGNLVTVPVLVKLDVRPDKLPEVITNSIGMKLTLIPAGEFLMGTNETKADLEKDFKLYAGFSNDDEHPRHRVRITKPFYLGTYEVTRGQFLKFYHGAKYKTDAEKDGKGGWGYTGDAKEPFQQRPEFLAWNTGFDQTDDHPVVIVSWNDADAFCQWLSKQEGKRYRLPTEAEWEYACRAGTDSRFYHGDDPEGLATIGNVADGTGKEKFPDWQYTLSARDGYVFTAPVGSFRANAFGLYDMTGNVWEWCADWYDKDYYIQSPSSDPQGPTAGSSRVIRGGGWGDLPVRCRSAYRVSSEPSFRLDGSGFRVACER